MTTNGNGKKVAKTTKKMRLGIWKYLGIAAFGLLCFTAGFNSKDTVSGYYNALKVVPAIANADATVIWATEVSPIATVSAQPTVVPTETPIGNRNFR